MVDCESVADTYTRYRHARSHVINALLRKCTIFRDHRVLEVGCGTGNHIRKLFDASNCSAFGIDPSLGMLRQAAHTGSLFFSKAAAEGLPFCDRSFDLVFSVNVIHHIRNPRAYFQEAFRILKNGALLCTLTDSEPIIRRRKPLASYWPGTVKADLERYPTIDSLRDRMAAAGFVDIEENEISESFSIKDATAYREKAFSCLHLISENEFQDGLNRLDEDLKRGPVAGVSEFVCLWARVPEEG